MNHRKRRNWTSTGVVACITAAAVFGTALPAHAMASPSSAPTSVSATATSTSTSTGADATPGAGTARATASGDVGDSARSWSTLIRTAINALKKIPALWNKLVNGVKKAYATFQRTVWPALKAVVGTISTLITAWDIWKFFN